MMRVLLINPERAEGELAAFPLGLAYIAAVLLRDGHQIDVVDLNAADDPNAILLSRLKGALYDAVGITAMIINLKQVQKLSETVKAHWPRIPIILGGGLATAIPEIVLADSQVDVAVIGEGEITAVELFRALSSGQDLTKVQGICFRQDDSVFHTLPRCELVNIEDLPFPAWDLFPMKTYLHNTNSSQPRMDLITGRGCPYHCTFCFSGIFGHKFRARSPESMVQEILTLEREYGVRSIIFRDDTFVLDRRRVLEFCDRLIAKNTLVTWSCNGRVDLMDREMLRRMRRAGCTNIGYGIESGNLEMLVRMRKQISIEEAKDVIKMTREEGIIPLGYFIIGMPGETAETIQDSIDFCKESGIIPHFGFAGPIPGTELYDYAVRCGYITDGRDYLLRADWKSMSVNMTELDNEELIQLGNSAPSEVMKYLLYHYPWLMCLIAWRFAQSNGIRAFSQRLLHWVVSSKWGPLSKLLCNK